MERIVILAKSLREANAYCREEGIRALFASNSTQVMNATKIIMLPGFDQRRDKFALAQAARNRRQFGKGVEFLYAEGWEMPKPVVTEAEIEHELEEGFAEADPIAQLDFTDDATLDALKAALNDVGITLKKLPAKKQDAPVVDAPVEF